MRRTASMLIAFSVSCAVLANDDGMLSELLQVATYSSGATEFPPIPLSGLVEYWRPSQTGDATGYLDAYNGTFQGTMGAALGIGFTNGNTTASRVLIGDHQAFEFTDGAGQDQPFTFCAWIRPSSLSGNDMLFTKTRVTAEREYIFFRGADDFQVTLYTDNANAIGHLENAGADLTNNTWTFVAVAYDGSEDTTNLWVYNNMSRTFDTYTAGTYTGMAFTNGSVAIGDWFFSGVPWAGDVDHVAVWSRELTPAELGEVYTNTLKW